MIINLENIMAYVKIFLEADDAGEIWWYVKQRMKGRDVKFRKDVIIRNNGVSYNCGRIMENCKVANSSFESYMFKRMKMKDGIFIDAGAHIGKYAIRMAKEKNVDVLAIEANRDTAKLLANNVIINNLKNVSIYNNFLDCKEGKTKFYVDPLHPATNTKEKRKGRKVEIIRNTTIDDIMRLRSEKLKVIKMDVEGNELNALKGGESSIRKDMPDIFFEAWNDKRAKEIKSLLIKWGYKIFRIDYYNYQATTKDLLMEWM